MFMPNNEESMGMRSHLNFLVLLIFSLINQPKIDERPKSAKFCPNKPHDA